MLKGNKTRKDGRQLPSRELRLRILMAGEASCLCVLNEYGYLEYLSPSFVLEMGMVEGEWGGGVRDGASIHGRWDWDRGRH